MFKVNIGSRLATRSSRPTVVTIDIISDIILIRSCGRAHSAAALHGGQHGTHNEQPGAVALGTQLLHGQWPLRHCCRAGADRWRRLAAGAGARPWLSRVDARSASAIVAPGRRRPDAGRPVHAAAQRGGDPSALRRLPRHQPRRRACAPPTRSIHARRSRCARATSTARSSRSTTSAATRSRSPPSWSGTSRTRPGGVRRRGLRGCSSRCRASRPCATWRSRIAYDHGEEAQDVSRTDAAQRRGGRRAGAACGTAGAARARPASSSRKRG